jgi:L-threonine-O-3-phosphate decarboxylase
MKKRLSSSLPPEQHIHGGSPRKVFTRLGIPVRDVIDFSVNVSPLGPPPLLHQQWNRLFREIDHYPSINGDGITDYYEARFNLHPNCVLPGNGSTECIYLVPRVLGFKKVGIVTPSFHDYERSCQLAGAAIKEIPLSEDNDFSAPDLNHLSKELEQLDALMLGNPNNPTNTLFAREDILHLADQHPDKWILVDEAFIQFLDKREEISLLESGFIRKNILVFHSLTKIFDLPGIRMGAVIGHPDTINHLKAHKEPWTVNGIAEKMAELLIQCGDYEEELRDLIRKERQRFFDALAGVKGIQLYPSYANFVLGRWEATDNLDDFLKFLLSHGFHVRDCRNFRNLTRNFFRFAILETAQNQQLISHLLEKFSKVRQ